MAQVIGMIGDLLATIRKGVAFVAECFKLL
jgi:hypothetical protein